MISILISSYNRLPLFRRVLWNIAKNPPSQPYELVVCDDGSTDNILGELKKYSAKIPFRLVEFIREEFEQKTGLKKYHNNPSVTNNVAFRHSKGDLIFLQGNEVIPFVNCYDDMIGAIPDDPYYIVFSTTFDVPAFYLNLLDDYGDNLEQRLVDACRQYPLQSKSYRSDVTNYLSLCPRVLWEKLGGYDELYYGGIAAEDSDFVRRARVLKANLFVHDAISLHQFHGGKTCYYEPQEISTENWKEGVSINHKIYHGWNGSHEVDSSWDYGTIGVGKIYTNME